MKVTWVHPTWRDLVIEQLSADPALRRRFLSRCGVHGAVLALSVAGGATGERALPLMAADGDWDVLGDRLYALIPELDTPDLVALLAAVAQAVEELRNSGPGIEAAALAQTVLARVRSRCDGAGQPIPLALLDAWLRAARRLGRWPEPPDLAITWTEVAPTRVPDPSDRDAVLRLADWLSLCELLARYDAGVPEALIPTGEHWSLCRAFLVQVGVGPDLLSEDHVQAALEGIAALWPDLSPMARRLAREGQASALEVGLGPIAAPEREAGAYAVGRILADL